MQTNCQGIQNQLIKYGIQDHSVKWLTFDTTEDKNEQLLQ